MKLDVYLVIGLTKESRHWSDEFVTALKEKLNPNSIQLVDLPGSGKLIKHKSPTSMKKIVEHARSQLTFHPNHQRLVVSISLGGMLAWSWVHEHPEDFTHLVMINSSLGSLSPVWKRVQPVGMLNFFKIAAAKNGHQKEKLILDLCSNNRKNAEKILPRWIKLGEEASMSLANTIRQVVAGAGFMPKSAPKIPMLVIAAKHDRLAHFSCSEAIADHASKFTEVKMVLSDDPEVGHAFHVDAPDYLSDTIQSWVTDSATSS
jgi:pimeloyl-[acyl-carrier protein] methyl ester esterase